MACSVKANITEHEKTKCSPINLAKIQKQYSSGKWKVNEILEIGNTVFAHSYFSGNSHVI